MSQVGNRIDSSSCKNGLTSTLRGVKNGITSDKEQQNIPSPEGLWLPCNEQVN